MQTTCSGPYVTGCGVMDIERAKLSRIEILKWVERCAAEKAEPVLKHNSLIAPIGHVAAKSLDSMRPSSADGATRLPDNLADQTTNLKLGAEASNTSHSLPSGQAEDLDEILETAEKTVTAEDRQTPPMERQQTSRLLDLPTEIRIRIFDQLMKPELPVCLLISTNVYLWGQGLPKDIASCARVCKHINREVQDIIWERLCFKIRADKGRGLPSSSLLGKTEDCELLNRIRHAEICFPIAAIQTYGDPDPLPNITWWLQLCAAAIERNSVLRSITFNCDTTAFVGSHDEKGVELVARTFRDVLAKKRDRGVRVKVINTKAQPDSGICVKVFREGGWKV